MYIYIYIHICTYMCITNLGNARPTFRDAARGSNLRPLLESASTMRDPTAYLP